MLLPPSSPPQQTAPGRLQAHQLLEAVRQAAVSGLVTSSRALNYFTLLLIQDYYARVVSVQRRKCYSRGSVADNAYGSPRASRVWRRKSPQTMVQEVFSTTSRTCCPRERRVMDTFKAELLTTHDCATEVGGNASSGSSSSTNMGLGTC